LDGAGVEGILRVYKKTGAHNITAYITFSSAESLEKALKIFPLPNKSGKPFLAKTCIRDASFWDKFGGEEKERRGLEGKKLRPSEAHIDIHKVITPLAGIPYTDQLLLKSGNLKDILIEISDSLAAVVLGSEGSGGGGAWGGGGKKRPRASLLQQASLPNEFTWLQENVQKYDGAACLPGPVLPSPQVEGYRNKVEFSIDVGEDGRTPVVGFRLASFSSGQSTVASSEQGFRNVPPPIVAIRDAAETFVRESPFPPYSNSGHEGVWRTLTVRWCHAEGKALVEIQVKPPSLLHEECSGEEATSPFESEVVRFTKAMACDTLHVSSLWIQEYSGLSKPECNHPRRHLSGSLSLIERLPHCGISYHISPGAFAQVNLPAADRLYFLARALAIDGVGGARSLLGGCTPPPPEESGGGKEALEPETSHPPALDFSVLPSIRRALTVLDICCGGGSLGLVCYPFVGKVIGVDVSEGSIADAVENSKLNGAVESRATWICGKAEEVMDKVLTAAKVEGRVGDQIKYSQGVGRAEGQGGEGGEASGVASLCQGPVNTASTELAAIVDPPRAGLHPSVIRSLRTLRGLNRVVYVSCNPKSFAGDAVKLCQPQRKSSTFARGPPFTLKFCSAVDMFPHTPGLEVVGLFERA